jgi:hypothetical protein
MDKKSRNNLKGKKRKIFVYFLIFWSLKISPAKANSLPGADGF